MTRTSAWWRSGVAVAACLALAAAAWAQGNSAVVTGADRVFVRRGPGTEFPPFATLTEGTTVEVQEMQGEWSRISTASGQVGYVHSNFLALPSEAGGSVAAGTARPQPTVRPTPRPEAAAPNPLTERNKALEAQVAALQDEVNTLKAHAAQPTAAPVPAQSPSSEMEDVRAELKRLTASIETLQHHTDAAGEPVAAGSAPAESNDGVSSTALLLGGVGLLLGWLIGAAYGRNQERGRRSRIRF